MILMVGMVSWAKPAAAADPIYLVNLVFSSTKLSIETGNTQTVKATAVYSDGSSKDVTLATDWKSGNEKVATILNGVITAVDVGTTMISGTYPIGSSNPQSTTLEVNVTKKVTSLTADTQKVDLRSNMTKDVILTANYLNENKEDVSKKAEWSTENNKIATVSNGTITGHDSGTTTITAKYGNQTVSIEVNVDVVRRLDTPTPEVSMLVKDLPKSIVIMATYQDGSEDDVSKKATWTSSNERIADVINGQIKAYAPGKATLKAAYGTKTIEIKVDIDSTKKLELSTQNLFMKVNDEKSVTLSATYANETSSTDVTDKATWTSSDENIVYVSKGTVIAKKSGTATITAKFSDKEVTLSVDVEVPRRLELNTTSSSIGLKNGDKYDLSLRAFYANASVEDITARATWTSSNEDIALVSLGKNAAGDDVATVTSYKSGDTKITASYGGKTVSIDVNVDIPRKLEFVGANTTAISLDLKETAALNVNAIYGDGRPTENVTSKAEWSSSDDKIAEVYFDSVQNAAIVTANDKGSATITAKYGTRSVTIKVEIAQASKLEANPKVLKMGKDEPKQIVLTATDSAGKPTEVQEKAEWTISSASVADVTKGLVTPLDSGKATITAKYGGKTVTIALEVKVVQKIEMSKKFISMKSGDTAALALSVTFSDGSVVDVSKDAEWKVGNYRVADVDNKGVVTAMSYGKTKVTAKYNNKSITTDIDVDQLKYLKTDVVTLEMPANSVKTVAATATFTDGTDRDVSIDGLWKSSSIKIADVKDGKITANSKGKATITITFGGKSTKIWVVVK
ncbi:hypothetical protein BVG16_20825 [Paenibacillus selenitireducens]|uniref:BIG2 domain-containing protein n=2 Tax=Paenibacillus selenitireducens TaxID=1324314 RepID=A0A1T2X816_9BACL|nr:hypothetical protein BVG16_20825 [Paenibacillus selenitireducens]